MTESVKERKPLCVAECAGDSIWGDTSGLRVPIYYLHIGDGYVQAETDEIPEDRMLYTDSGFLESVQELLNRLGHGDIEICWSEQGAQLDNLWDFDSDAEGLDLGYELDDDGVTVLLDGKPVGEKLEGCP